MPRLSSLAAIFVVARSRCLSEPGRFAVGFVEFHANPSKEEEIMATPPKLYLRKDAQERARLNDQRERQSPQAQQIKHLHLPSGLQRGIPFLISADWSAEDALAAFEIFNDLCEAIWNHYQFPIQDLLREQRRPVGRSPDSSISGIDDPF